MAPKKSISPAQVFTRGELRSLRALSPPWKIQKFLDGLGYHLADTAYSPRRVLRERTAHCFEGALFAAAALRVNGRPPLIVDLEAERDTDHVIAVYRVNGLWGSIATSNYASCRGRQPVYRTLRELVMSYFDGYFNLASERTLRTYSRPVDMRRFDRQGWMTSEEDLWYVARYLFTIHHTPLLPRRALKQVRRVDARTRAAGLVGHRRP